MAVTLPSLAIPVALSAGVEARSAAGAWLVWVLGFGVATFAVRDAIAHLKGRRSLLRRLLPIAVAVGLAVGAAASGVMGAARVAAAGPMLLVSLALALRPPHPRRLRRVGWVLVLASIATAVGVAVTPASGQL